MKSLINLFSFLVVTMFVTSLSAQIQYTRLYDKTGLNVFEPSKTDETPFDGFKIRIGGSFTQDYQNFTVKNKANYVRTSSTNPLNKNYLYGYIKAEDTLSSKLAGFNLAMANLNFDIQIGDGIRVFLENYMSSRHHSEFWVKGGFIQIDKLPMFNNPEWFTKYLRVKIGHFQPNYGDFQFRRSDGGNTIFNPFTENLILDAFTTEIGGEVYIFPAENLMLMGGMTSGFISGNIIKQPDAVNSSGVVPTKRNPSLFAKIAYDKSSEELRYRLSASVYHNSNIQRNTMFAGDRTGSHWFGVMEPATIGGLPISIGTSPSNPATQAGPNFASGRFDPGVANRLTTFNISPFVKFKGLEVQGGVDVLKGSVYQDVVETSGKKEWTKRSWNQFYAEAIYRFLKNEEVYIGARYVNANGEPNGLKYDASDTGKTANSQAKVGINRFSVGAGYFATKNMLLKLEYTNQKYKDFPKADYRNEGEFSGVVIEAVIGF
ncbi:MAG: hypothetical protein IPK35_22095 [Saprospiraceae bacterium]|jgi:hypothetical protein|nr:hypothetical protein [Saprospiraceae bacterium]